MLNRRYLRIKVMQALYAYFQGDVSDIRQAEKRLFVDVGKIYDLYIYLMQLLLEVRSHAERVIEDSKLKRLPTAEDLTPNLKFIQNKFLQKLADNKRLQSEVRNRKVSWQDEGEMVKKMFNLIKTSEEYADYMKSDNESFRSHKSFIEDVYKHFIAGFELMHSMFEERNINWADDIDFVHAMVVKTISNYSESNSPEEGLLELYKDEKDDKAFMSELLTKTILHDKENAKFVAEKTKNWEVDRIALMDILLMKMAITEVLRISNVPVKVSLNEYIEISKMYSTPKSKIFINGVLDKLVADFKEKELIKKTGRGLVE